eukprot:1161626-Pleurochrysis_carterae.AAC.1
MSDCAPAASAAARCNASCSGVSVGLTILGGGLSAAPSLDNSPRLRLRAASLAFLVVSAF